MTLLILYFCLAVVVSFVCSLLEAVLLTLSHAQIALLVEEGRKSGLMFKRYKDKIDHPLSAILTLNTVANTVGAAGVGAQALHLFDSGSVAFFSGALTFCILVFSEIVPKTLGAVHARRLAPTAAYFIRALIVIAYPFVVLFEFIGRLLTPKEPQARVTREEMMVAADMGRAEGSLQDREQMVIQNLLRLKNIPVRAIMTPRSVLFALPQDITAAEALDKNRIIAFSRIPLYEENRDNITGLLLRNKLNRAYSHGKGDTPLIDLAGPIRVVPQSKTVADVLEDFIAQREHLFLVVDEYGGTAGIITLEDAVETLLGAEIVDELDSVDDMQQLALEQYRKRRNVKEE